MAETQLDIRAQPGFQTKCLSSKADITIIGGNAGGGKTTVMILDGVRRSRNGEHRGITFRAQATQIRAGGGLWDAAMKFYGKLVPTPQTNLYHHFTFASGAKEEFNYLTRDKDLIAYQGPEYSVIRFDQLEHFWYNAFIYMLSRLRSTSGINPYVLASCNPQGSGWLKNLISWWLYPPNYELEHLQDYPIPERDGKLRWFINSQDVLFWGDSAKESFDNLPDEYKEQYTEKDAKSITFIEGKLSENKILNEINPGYESNLKALPEDERQRLYGGRWRESDSDEKRLFFNKVIQDCLTNSFVKSGEGFITSDIALEGNDRFTIAIWSGWRLLKLLFIEKDENGRNGKKVLDTIIEIAKRMSIPYRNICYDATGIGDYLGGFLTTAYSFKGASSPIVTEEEKKRREQAKRDGKTKDPEEYYNLRSQCFYHLAKKMSDNEVYLNLGDEQKRIYSIELPAIKKLERDDRKLAIIPKRLIKVAIGWSPDVADVLSMRSVFDLIPRPVSSGKIRAGVV